MSGNVERVRSLLTHFHEKPTADIPNDALLTIYTHLLDPPSSSTESTTKVPTQHWFCPLSKPLDRKAAVFLLRLTAYPKSEPREKWGYQLVHVTSNCFACSDGLEAARQEISTTFLRFLEDQSAFWTNFESVHKEEVLHFSRGQSHPTTSPGLVYLILSHFYLFTSPDLLTLFEVSPPAAPFLSWPKNRVSPGVIVLMMHENLSLRLWARNQCTHITRLPIPTSAITKIHRDLLLTVAFGPPGRLDEDKASSQKRVLPFFSTFPFCHDPLVLWQVFQVTLRFLPSECIVRRTEKGEDVRTIVYQHLSDDGDHFPGVLQCFLVLLNHLGPECWKGLEQFPLPVLDRIKDNPSFLNLIAAPIDQERQFRYLSWFEKYLTSVFEMPSILNEALPRIAQFMIGDLQHTRFANATPRVMTAFCAILSNLEGKRTSDSAFTTSLADTITIHAKDIVNVAFGTRQNEQLWTEACDAARKLLKSILLGDLMLTSTCIQTLVKHSNFLKRQLKGDSNVETPAEPPPVVFRTELWRQTLLSLRDYDAVTLVLEVVAAGSHLSPLNQDAYFPKKIRPPPSLSAFLNQVNTFLGAICDYFLEGFTIYTEYDLTISDIFENRPDLIKYATKVLLSPMTQFSSACRNLVALAFAVDDRQECLRALLTKNPSACMGSLIDVLEKYSSYSRLVPEAISLTKSVVTSFTEILEILCLPPEGLLRDTAFLELPQPAGVHFLLPQFWRRLVQMLTSVCTLAPSWSKFVPSASMVLWMRDTFIVGGDVLKYRYVFESAIRLSNETKAKGVVTDLVELLPGIVQWLRITDEELLHLAFAWLQKLLETFRDAKVQPSKESLEVFRRRVQAATSEDVNRTRLDRHRARQLESFLSWFTTVDPPDSPSSDDDDDIEIVPPPLATPKVLKPALSSLPAQKVSAPKLSAPPKARSKQKSSKFSVADEARLATATSLSMPTFRPNASSSSKTANPPRSASISSAASASERSWHEDDEDSDSNEGGPSLADRQRSPIKVKKSTFRDEVRVERPRAPTRIVDEVWTGGRLHKLNRDQAPPPVQIRPPNFVPLHLAILSWDYDHTGTSPPGHSSSLVRIPDAFSNVQHYEHIFWPLLLQETWGQLLQSKDEQLEKVDVRVQNRSYADEFLVTDIEILSALPSEWYLATQTDIVLLRSTSSQTCVLAKVDAFTRNKSILTATLQTAAQMGGALTIHSTWTLSKVISMSTLHREYAALKNIAAYNLRSSVLRAVIQPKGTADSVEATRLQSRYRLNEPQSAAVLSAIERKDFVLIQGPPGTGKTSTICGLVSANLERKQGTPAKVLVCAPSNAAIDEVCFRLNADLGPGKVVRVGTDSAVNQSVKAFTLTALVDRALNAQQADNTTKSAKREELKAELEMLRAEKTKLISEQKALQDNSARHQSLSDQIRRAMGRETELRNQNQSLAELIRKEGRDLDRSRRQEAQRVLNSVSVVCSTLSGAGHPQLDPLEFDTVIIDEAAQAIELSSLIPLKFNASRYVLVGDPQQLAPTVISSKASDAGYNQSLFVRLQRQNPDSAHLLSIQYRMHPEISCLPSALFYAGRLGDGPGLAQSTARPWHSNPRFGPYRFYNINGGREENVGHSHKNVAEINAAMALYDRLHREHSSHDFTSKIGIITMYRTQLLELRKAFSLRFGRTIRETIDFNTVDGFQGQEKDIIILSCVRAGPSTTNIGFLADTRRMNVALTRAKSSLYILGHASTLHRSNEDWKKIVDNAKHRNLMVDNASAAWFQSQEVLKHHPLPPSPARKGASSNLKGPQRPVSANKTSSKRPPSPMIPVGQKHQTNKLDDQLPAESQLPPVQRLSSPASKVSSTETAAIPETAPSFTASSSAGPSNLSAAPNDHSGPKKKRKKEKDPMQSMFINRKKPRLNG